MATTGRLRLAALCLSHRELGGEVMGFSWCTAGTVQNPTGV
jgi:hypothetical protein